MHSQFVSGAKTGEFSQFFLLGSSVKPLEKTESIAWKALGSLILLAGALYVFRKVTSLNPNQKIEKRVQSYLPEGHSVTSIDKIEGGFSNDLWKITTLKKAYVFRLPKHPEDASRFQLIVEISKEAAKEGISPQVVGVNIDKQEMVLEWMGSTPWPTYVENPIPYQRAMKALKVFHENMSHISCQIKSPFPAPFSFIFTQGKKLTGVEEMPSHFFSALEKTEAIFHALKPWLSTHATLCHGDFHKGNVLLSKNRPFLIDFDSASVGDPFFDVAKFSISLPQDDRQKLFKEYLGGRLPTGQEQAHFELIDLALLMVVVTVRFTSAQNTKNGSQERLTKEEMEEILSSKNPPPSFLNMPFGDTSCMARQKGATYALYEFCKRIKLPSFKEFIDHV